MKSIRSWNVREEKVYENSKISVVDKSFIHSFICSYTFDKSKTKWKFVCLVVRRSSLKYWSKIKHFQGFRKDRFLRKKSQPLAHHCHCGKKCYLLCAKRDSSFIAVPVRPEWLIDRQNNFVVNKTVRQKSQLGPGIYNSCKFPNLEFPLPSKIWLFLIENW